MDFERKLKNKTLLTVMLVLLVLCAIYFTLGLKNQKQYIDWQIQKENEIASLEIKNVYQKTNQLYRNKIQYFVNNPNLKKEFHSKNIESLYRKVFPFYSILKSEDSYHFEINFYTKDNLLALNMESGTGNINKSVSNNSFVFKANKENQRQTGFEIVNSLLYYKIVNPIVYKGEHIGCVEFAIRENEILDYLTKSFNISIASLFDAENLSENVLDGLKSTKIKGKYLIHSAYNENIFTELEKYNSLTPGKFKLNEKYYYLDIVNIENDFQDEGLEGILYIRDISVLQNQFQAILYRSLLIIFLILSSTYIILHFSFSNLIYKFFNLQDSLDKRLAQKSKEIIKSNDELNQIFNNSANSMRLIDTDFNIFRVNRAFTSMSGISKENAEGKKCFNVISGPNCHTANCSLNRIINGEDKIEQDVIRKNIKGDKIHGIINSVAFKGQNGEILGIIEDFKDISQRVKVEKALKRTEQQFSIFMDNLPLGVFIKDENFKSVYVNKYMDIVFSDDGCQGKSPEEIFPQEYANRVINEDKKVSTGEVLIVEDQLPNKFGELNYYLTHKFRFKGVDNNWLIGGISIDITEKRKTEYQLKILSNAIQHSPTCVVITNLEGNVEIVNPSFTKITGYSSKDVIGKNISILHSDTNKSNTFQNIINTVIEGKDWQGEFHNKKKNGEKYWESASISPVINDSFEITHFVVISEDITSRKRNEKELINAKEKAEESNRLKTAFLGNLSHEIRTPMNAIIGFSNLLLDEDILHTEKIKLNDLINENSHNLLKLIDDVIDVSKLQSGDIQLNNTTCDLNKLLLDIYVTFSVQIENDLNKDIHLSMNTNFENNNFSIITDSNRLKQILSCLIENAIKFTDKGFVDFGYTISKNENKIQFYVIDSGIGISNEKFDHIYDMFRQADESFTRKHGGTGIGLTIAKNIVSHLGGEIWLQSTPNQGTNIYFTLPYEIVDSKFEITKKTLGSEFDWHNKVVLIADDIDINFQFLEEILSPTKVKIIWAKNGKEAVELCLKNDNIDLVLMDIKMPVMDGFEAARQIKKHNSNLKIIGQTAYVKDYKHEKYLKEGFDNYFSKPIKDETLLSTIEQVFSKN
ncbi:MAG: PAS domain S-box protein [Bacteroidales bacterium]|nr:PAS domain S-box protein [Bacteroidales bacterium]